MQTMGKIVTGAFVLWGLICFVVLVYFLARISTEGGNEDTASCTISINKDLGDPQPLMLDYPTSHFILPSTEDVITLTENQLIFVACPNGSLLLSGVSTAAETGLAECRNGSFVVRGQNFSFNEITCTRMPYHTARFDPWYSCASQGSRAIQIGFIVNNIFLNLISVCFDTVRQHTIYTEFTLTKTIGGYQSGFPRPYWLQGSGFFNVRDTTVGALYNRNQQRVTINTLLGLPEDSLQYIKEDDFYLSRGHLVAKADFVFGSQQRATFYYLNAAPQWQTINGANWNHLEQDVRGYASRNAVDLLVYTGTYGVTTLPHASTGEDVELYLYVDGSNRGIPVPRLFWKILYEPIARAATVFISVNNPYVFNPVRDVICTNVCESFEWLSWNASNHTYGYSYCCELEDFQRIVTDLPYLDVRSVLV